MKFFPYSFLSLAVVLGVHLLLSACDQFKAGQSNPVGNRPELDCIIANDFYAMHFSAYLQPSQGQFKAGDKAAFVPYCQEIPDIGEVFFSADLIDRDIRETPIGIRLVEVAKTGKEPPDDFSEIRVITEEPSKLYPKGTVEAKAKLDKKGNYILYLLIGDAVEEDDKFKIHLQVGEDAYSKYAPYLIVGLVGIFILVGLILVYNYVLKRRNAHVHHQGEK